MMSEREGREERAKSPTVRRYVPLKPPGQRWRALMASVIGEMGQSLWGETDRRETHTPRESRKEKLEREETEAVKEQTEEDASGREQKEPKESKEHKSHKEKKKSHKEKEPKKKRKHKSHKHKHRKESQEEHIESNQEKDNRQEPPPEGESEPQASFPLKFQVTGSESQRAEREGEGESESEAIEQEQTESFPQAEGPHMDMGYLEVRRALRLSRREQVMQQVYQSYQRAQYCLNRKCWCDRQRRFLNKGRKLQTIQDLNMHEVVHGDLKELVLGEEEPDPEKRVLKSNKNIILMHKPGCNSSKHGVHNEPVAPKPSKKACNTLYYSNLGSSACPGNFSRPISGQVSGKGFYGSHVIRDFQGKPIKQQNRGIFSASSKFTVDRGIFKINGHDNFTLVRQIPRPNSNFRISTEPSPFKSSQFISRAEFSSAHYHVGHSHPRPLCPAQDPARLQDFPQDREEVPREGRWMQDPLNQDQRPPSVHWSHTQGRLYSQRVAKRKRAEDIFWKGQAKIFGGLTRQIASEHTKPWLGQTDI